MTVKSNIQIVEPSVALAPNHIRIFLRDCKTNLRVGVYAKEMEAAQPVIINVEMEAALPHHYQNIQEQSLDRVINYEPVYNFIQNELPQMGHIPLLETVAEQIITFCFQDVRIQKVRVCLEKLQVFESASAGIEVCRARS